MTAWVIARPVTDSHILRWQFWCGNQDREKYSLYRCDAYHFARAGEAHLVATTHEDLQDSDEWRVINAATANGDAGLALLKRAAKGIAVRECDN